MMQTIEIMYWNNRTGNEVRTLLKHTKGSAGMDLSADIEVTTRIVPGEVLNIPTGIAIHISDPTLCGIIVPRSGLGSKYGIILANTTGVIDSDYTGQLIVSLWNRSDLGYSVSPMERVAQLLIVPVPQVKMVEVDQFTTTERGTLGFGSTGRV
jgi:dUTP pyrophosphatase